MKTNNDNFPFYGCVPRPLGIVILMIMFFPPTFSGGAYLSNAAEMVGGLGVLTEDVQLASFFTSIGMCLFPPFMIKFLQTRRVKQTYLSCFGLLFILNWICAETTSLPLLLGTCLLTGFVRSVVMIHCTFTIAPYLTGMNTLEMFMQTERPNPAEQYAQERKRTFLMPVLYFYILFIAQLSNAVTAWFAYNYSWRMAYYFVMAMLLVAMLIVYVSMPDEKKCRIKIDAELLPDMCLMAVSLCSLVYILVFGKTLDWFNDTSICLVSVVFLLSTSCFCIIARRHHKIYYIPFEIFKYRNVSIALLLFFLFMIFNSASQFITLNAKISAPINNMQGAFLSYWAIVGCFIGVVIALLLVVCKVRFRTVFVVGLSLMAASNIYMYFYYQSIGVYSDMALPMILNYAGLLIMYALVPAFSMKHIKPSYLVATVFIMIWARNAVAPVVGATIYGNWLNEQQQHYIVCLADDIDIRNTVANNFYRSTTMLGKLQGKSGLESESLATTSLKGKVTVQATFLAMKDITGVTIWLILGTICFVMLLPYKKNETT